MRSERGGMVWSTFAIIGIVVVLLLLGVCALVNDDNDDPNSYRPVQVASHDYDGGDNGCWDGECYDGGGRGDGDSYGNGRYDYDYSSRDRHRNERRNRGAFSPGPFDRSPVTVIICPPGTQYCGSDGGRGQEPPPDEGGTA